MDQAFADMSKNLLSNQGPPWFSLMFSSKSFIGFCFPFMFVTYVKFCIRCKILVEVDFLSYEYPVILTSPY